MTYETTFVYPNGRTSRLAFTLALIPLLAAVAFYIFIAKAGRNGEWVQVTLLFPAFMLHARRLHDLGQTAWLLLVPAAVDAFAIGLHMAGARPDLQPAATWAAILVSAAFVLWGLIGKGQAGANRFGVAAA